MKRVLLQRLVSLALIAGLFLLWEMSCLVFGISDVILPRPSQVLLVIWQKWPAILPHALQTLYTTIIGLGWGVVFGVLFGVLIGSSRLAYESVYPLLVGFNSIPKVAVVPILVLWFGTGTTPAALTSMTISMFPIVVNVAAGLAATEPELEDVLRTLKATKLDILWNVGLPRTAPYFFASLKVAATLSFVGTVISETVASNRGIGNMMMTAASSLDVPLVFSGLVILAVMGIGFHAVFTAIERRLAGWASRKSELLAT
jgi:NitT/TauT family transport system permease protein